jgi:hypothetical protein
VLARLLLQFRLHLALRADVVGLADQLGGVVDQSIMLSEQAIDRALHLRRRNEDDGALSTDVHVLPPPGGVVVVTAWVIRDQRGEQPGSAGRYRLDSAEQSLSKLRSAGTIVLPNFQQDNGGSACR